jgi:hypothetical protein
MGEIPLSLGFQKWKYELRTESELVREASYKCNILTHCSDYCTGSKDWFTLNDVSAFGNNCACWSVQVDDLVGLDGGKVE